MVLDLLCQDVINRFGSQPEPMMPIVVLQAQEPGQDAEVTHIVQVLYRVFCRGRFMCTNPSPDPRPEEPVPRDRPDEPWRYDRSLEMLRRLTSSPWGNLDNSRYRPYSFPRSRMLAAIEDAVRAVGGDQDRGESLSPEKKVLRHLGTEWKPALSRKARPAFSSAGSVLGPLVVVAVGALLGHFTALRIGVILGVALLVWAALLGFQFVRRNRGPLSWLGQASLWFATTTFLFPEKYPPARRGRSASRRSNWNPRRSWRDRQDRAGLVVRYLIATGYGSSPAGSQSPAPAAPHPSKQDLAWRFYLQLRVLALLEDLRAGHRPWTLDLRRRKRTRPPVVFLPAASRVNGGLPLLQAVSDVRSRRSEQDPLLILASTAHGTSFEHWHGEGSVRSAGENMYEAWTAALRVDQSPSLKSAWPWVLRYPLTPRNLEKQTGDKSQPAAPRSAWTWTWSRLSAACLLIVVTAVAVPYQVVHQAALRDQQQARHKSQEARLAGLARLYCGGRVTGSVHDLMLSPLSRGQCVGIDTTDALDFVPSDGGISLNGAVPGGGGGGGESAVGAGISARRLVQLIRAQNRIAENASSHVTFVYAGALTSSTNGTGEKQALNSVKELVGVYTWQFTNNSTNALVKVRIDIANGGQNMASQVLMAQKIAAAAQQDPTVVGVIGMGRDTPDSLAAVQDLGAAGLAVIDTTDSDDGPLTQQWNYFGLAATNAEEVAALRPEIAGDARGTAVVFEPSGSDPYSQEQALAATAMLKRAKLSLVGGDPLTYQVSGDDASFAAYSGSQGAICGGPDRPSVVYLAGRSGDLTELLNLLSSSADCFARHITVLAGDDLTKTQLTDSGPQGSIPSNVTLYYVALTDVAKTGGPSPLNVDLRTALTLPTTPRYGDPFFADGTVALGFDAAHALYLAATEAEGQRFAVPSFLRCVNFTNAATGQVWFNGVRHGIAVVTVPSGTGKASYAYAEAKGDPCASGRT